MADMDTHALMPVMDAASVQALIRDGLPAAAGVHVEAVGPATATVRLAVDDSMSRPGGTVSGPTLFAAADTAMYAVILAHVGPQALAVTTDTTIHFLRRPALRDVLATAELVKLGKRLAVCRVTLRSVGDDATIAVATGTYSLPPRG